MKINVISTNKMYRELVDLPVQKRADFFRYEMMQPFETMWNTIGVPIKATEPNGYDVVMAASKSGMGSPTTIDEEHLRKVAILESSSAWTNAEKVIKDCLRRFQTIGFEMQNVTEINFGIFVADSNNPQIKMSKGYTGFGGIPGYFMVMIDPNDYTLKRLPLAIAHEFNHQIRLTYEPWKMNINLGEYIIIEGLAERFAAEMYGEDLVGPWISSITEKEFAKVKQVFKNSLSVQGFGEVASYMFGDDLARIQGYQPVGVPYCAGYAIGYHLIKHYLNKSGKSIEDATLTSSNEILHRCEDFWS